MEATGCISHWNVTFSWPCIPIVWYTSQVAEMSYDFFSILAIPQCYWPWDVLMVLPSESESSYPWGPSVVSQSMLLIILCPVCTLLDLTHSQLAFINTLESCFFVCSWGWATWLVSASEARYPYEVKLSTHHLMWFIIILLVLNCID